MFGRDTDPEDCEISEFPSPRRRQRWCRALVDGRTDAIRAAFARLGIGVPELCWSPAPGDCIAVPNRFLVEHWHALRGARALPRHDALDPVALRPALGFVNLVEATVDGADFCYRVFGSFVGTAVGRDLTGRRMTEAPADSRIVDLGIAACHAAGERREPILIRRAEVGEPPPVRWERVFFPFEDAAGRVARLAICAVPLDDSGRPLRLDPFQGDRRGDLSSPATHPYGFTRG